MIGSPGFMSPEQATADEITPASDVFSLGATLAYAATGNKPFGEAATPALLYRVVHEEPDLEGLDNPELRPLAHGCLAKNADDLPTPQQILCQVGSGSEPAIMVESPAWRPVTARIRAAPQHDAASPLPHPLGSTNRGTAVIQHGVQRNRFRPGQGLSRVFEPGRLGDSLVEAGTKGGARTAHIETPEGIR